MPVQFLTKKQQRRYGRYDGEPTVEQLAQYFHLDDHDHAVIQRLRGASNRLGFALQLGTVRFLGTFVSDPAEVPNKVIRFVADQLPRQRNMENLARYAQTSTFWRHADRIKKDYGYREFSDRQEGFRLVRWLFTRAWLSEERPSVLGLNRDSRKMSHLPL